MRTKSVVLALFTLLPSCKEKLSDESVHEAPIETSVAKDAAVARPADASGSSPVAFAPTRNPESIKFSVHPSLGTARPPATQPACVHAPNQKPDGASPPNLVYRFEQGVKNQPCTFPDLDHAGLYVFDRADFARTVPGAEKNLESLEALLSERPKELQATPFAPFVDATQAYVARAEYIDFEGGAGVLVFTEFSTEPDILFKEPLYVFEGLSTDKKTYVAAVFPVAVDISVPTFRWNTGDIAEATERHKLYTARIREDANNLRSKSIVPRPEAIASTMRSLVLTEEPSE